MGGLKMKYREFWIEDRSSEYADDQFWARDYMAYDTDTHVIEIDAYNKAVEVIKNEITILTAAGLKGSAFALKKTLKELGEL
jgi:hypothetical protein